MTKSFLLICLVFILAVFLPTRTEAGFGSGVSGTFALDARDAFREVPPQGISPGFSLDAQGAFRLQLPNSMAGPFALDARGVPGNLGFGESNLFSVGEGTATRGEPLILVSPDSLIFRDVVIGAARTDTLTIRNTGTDTLKVTTITSSDPAFTFSPASFAVVPGGSQKLAVKFAPTAAGEKLATLMLNHNTRSGSSSMKLKGTGIVSTSTDTAPPALVTSLPASGAKDVNAEAVNTDGVVITFTEAINTAKIQVSFQTGDQKLSWQPTWSESDTRLTLKPAKGSELGFQKEYRVTLSQVMDKAGNIASDIAITFMTGLAPPPGARTVSFAVPASAAPGSEIVVSIQLSDAKGIAGGDFIIFYDPNILTAKSVKQSPLLVSNEFLLTPNLNTPGQVKVVLAGSTAILSGSGPIFTITFTVKPDAKDGTYPLKFDKVTLRNETAAIVPAATRDGALTTAIAGQGTQPPQTPVLSISPSSISFGMVVVGSVKMDTVTVTNSGGGSLTISVESTGITNTDFEAPTTLNVTLTSGQSVKISVAFRPKSSGTKETVLLLSHNAKNIDSPAGVKLSGAGVAVTPDIITDPTSLSFGGVRLGQTQKVTLTIQNKGNADLSVDSLSADNPTFSVPSTAFKLAPNGKRDIEISFTPSAPDSLRASLKIISNDPDQPTLRIPLAGVGQAPSITATPLLLDFKRVPLDSSVSQTLTIGNTGTSDLSVDSLVIAGKWPFTISQRSFTLKPGSSQKVDIRVTSTEIDSLLGALTIFSDAFNNSRLLVQIRGLAVSPKIVVTPTEIGFGTVAFGDTSSAMLTIRNEGNDLLIIQKITVSDRRAFSLSDSALTLAPNASRNIRIFFKSLAAGDAVAELNIQSNDRRRKIVTIPLSVKSRSAPDIALSETSHEYGFVTPGVSVPWVLTVRNTGTEKLTITRITAEPPFAIQGESPKTVAAGDSARLTITFLSSQVGDFTGRLTILTDDPDEREVFVRLSGSTLKLTLTLDIDPTPGNQKNSSAHASPSAPIQIAVYVEGVSDISGYSFVVAFDSTAVRFKSAAEKTDKEDNILKKSGGNAFSLPPILIGNSISFGAAILGPTASNVVSGGGFLGVLIFEPTEKFKMSEGTLFTLHQINLKRLGENERPILTRVVAEVKSGIVGDFNGDGQVDFSDFFIFAEGFGRSRGAPGFDSKIDLNGDGTVDFSDFFVFAENFGKGAK